MFQCGITISTRQVRIVKEYGGENLIMLAELFNKCLNCENIQSDAEVILVHKRVICIKP